MRKYKVRLTERNIFPSIILFSAFSLNLRAPAIHTWNSTQRKKSTGFNPVVILFFDSLSFCTSYFRWPLPLFFKYTHSSKLFPPLIGSHWFELTENDRSGKLLINSIFFAAAKCLRFNLCDIRRTQVSLKEGKEWNKKERRKQRMESRVTERRENLYAE